MKLQTRDYFIIALTAALAVVGYQTWNLFRRVEELSKTPPQPVASSRPMVAFDAPVQPAVQSPVPDAHIHPPAPETTAPSGPTTTITFKKMSHDFGKVKQNSENVHWFEFTNSGKEPLVISSAQASCGCTVPDYPKEPIPPGGKGRIKVVYSPGMQEGQQSKTVTITANTQPPQTILTITANVVKE